MLCRIDTLLDPAPGNFWSGYWIKPDTSPKCQDDFIHQQ